MGYSLYVSAAKEFVPAFYRKLFEKGSVSEAVRAGREEMYRQPQRSCVTGKLPPPGLGRSGAVPADAGETMPASPASSRIARGRKGDRLCPQEADLGDYGFIGRDWELQQLERAMQRQPQAALLIHG